MSAEQGTLLLLSIIAALLIGACTRSVLKHSRLPYTVGLLIIGLAIGLWERQQAPSETLSEALNLLAYLDPHLILFAFLPILIFESVMSLEVHLFRRLFSQIAILAVVGVLISAALTALLIMFVLPLQWSWIVALLFGTLISATDPVAVVALLKEICSRKRLETLIEGESLLNDGTAIVLFSLFLGYLSAAGGELTFASAVTNFVWVVCMGVVAGGVIGSLALLWIGRIYNDAAVEITISIGTAYLVFFVAEHLLHASGVVALVTAASLFAGAGRTYISAEVAGFMHRFWEVMAYIANTLIFLLVGLLIAKRIDISSSQMWITLLLLYLGILVIRAITVGLLYPWLARVGAGFNFSKAAVLTWGGLRGAVSLALALTLVQGSVLSNDLADQVLFLCAGVVVLTLLVNATTMSAVLKALHLDQLPAAKQATLDKAKGQIQQDLSQYIAQLEQDEFLRRANWHDINQQLLKPSSKPSSTSSESELQQAFERRLLEVERKHYWHQYHQGVTDRDSTQILIESVEKALDGSPALYPREHVGELWHIPAVLQGSRRIPWFNRLLLHLFYRRLTLGYEVTCGFIRAQQAMLQHVEQLAPSDQEQQHANQAIQQNIDEAYQRTELIRQVVPELIQTLETNAAQSLILRRQRSSVQQLLDQALLDKPEAEKMINEIEQQLAQQKSQLPNFSKPPVPAIFSHHQWSSQFSEQQLEQLSMIAEHRVYQKGDVLLPNSQGSADIVFILRGDALLVNTAAQNEQQPLSAGAVVGHQPLAAEAKVVAQQLVDCLVFPEQRLNRLVPERGEFAARLEQIYQP